MWHIINALILRELKTRFGKNPTLGYIWVILEPTILIILIIVFYSFVLDRKIEQLPFGLFLTIGIIPFFMFRKIIMNMLNGIEANKALFTYKPVKAFYILISRTILEAIIYIFIFILIMSINTVLFDHDVVPDNLLITLLIFLWIIIFSFSTGLILTSLFYNNESIKTIIAYFLIFFYIGSAVVIPIWIIPNNFINYLSYNPMLHLLELFKQNYFIEYPKIRQINYGYPTIFTLCTIFFGLYLYKKNRIKLESVGE